MGITVEDLIEVTSLNDTDLLHVRETVSNQDNKLSWENFKKLLSFSNDGLSIGDFRFSSTSKDRTAEGLIQWAFDNAISIANFPVLWDVIGHMFNAQHVAAGDTDLSASSTLFYPTPVPGAYNRAGIPDISLAEADFTDDAGKIKVNHGITALLGNNAGRTGTAVKFYADSGSTLPTGLTEGTVYYLIFDATTTYFWISTTEEFAIGISNRINFTDDGIGTFRLTQEGIVLGYTFQGHWHEMYNQTGVVASGALTGIRNTNSGNASQDSSANDDTFIRDAKTDGKNGTPRTTNETRPKTNYSFGYIKAEHVTSAGEPISALRYDTGWMNYDNTFQSINLLITHNLNAAPQDIVATVYFSNTGGTDIYNITSGLVNDQSIVGDYGVLLATDSPDDILNTINLLTGSDGFLTLTNSGVGTVTIRDNSDTGFMRVVLIKPNLINTVFDVSNMPKTYDLTSADVTKTLPEITGALQVISWYWENGDGTYKVTPAVTDGATIDGRPASDYIGEGKGGMTVESDGTNWQLRKYEDYLDFTTQRVWKSADGTEKQQIELSQTAVMSSAFGSLFRTASPAAITRLHTLNSLKSESMELIDGGGNAGVWIANAGVNALVTATSRIYFVSGISYGSFLRSARFNSIGRWLS